jgi:hypothetical protein
VRDDLAGWRSRLVVLVVVALVWSMPSSLSKLPVRRALAPASPAANAPSAPERKINATLYYVSEDGLSLPGVQREVAFADNIADQARRIVEAQLGDAPAPYASAIPQGTPLRALFIGDRGEVFAPGGEVRTKHPGGRSRRSTAYSIVNALTVNLPATHACRSSSTARKRIHWQATSIYATRCRKTSSGPSFRRITTNDDDATGGWRPDSSADAHARLHDAR